MWWHYRSLLVPAMLNLVFQIGPCTLCRTTGAMILDNAFLRKDNISLTYFQAVFFGQTWKSSNLRNQWWALPVLHKPISFLLAVEICARELACC
jgi:hypothetical protein